MTYVQNDEGHSFSKRPCASGYLPKFSDSFAQELLNNQASDFALARRILTDYHPLQPEMVLQLAAQQHPQFRAKGQVRKFIVPIPWAQDEPPKLVQKYMDCKWRGAGMTLLEWLRKSGSDGQIHQRYQRLHKARNVSQPVEQWINSIPAEGEIMVAAITNSRNKDKFFGQWLLLHVPFNSLDDLWDQRADLVPEDLKFLALAVLKRPSYWRQPGKIEEDMEREARGQMARENILAMLAARLELVDKYLNGGLTKADFPEPPPTAAETAVSKAFNFAPEQKEVQHCMHVRVGVALEARDPEGPAPEDWANWLQDEPPKNHVTAVLGPAGSGKSTAVEVGVVEAIQRGAHVGIACPTGMLAAAYKVKFPELDVDTIHGMFGLFKNENETLEMMRPYDLVVIDEVGQLSQATFERLMRLWDAADNRPAVMLVGDFFQLQPIDPTTAKDSPRWGRDVRKIHLWEMRRCKCPELRWKLEMLRSTRIRGKQAKKIARGHRAPQRIPPERRDAKPTLADVQQVLKETPYTTFLTNTRKGARMLNDLVLEALYGGEQPLRTIPCDPDENPDNFDGQYLVAADPYMMPVHKGMRLTITKNEDKEHGFVNGMGAVVVAVLRRGILVQTDADKTLNIHPVSRAYILPDGTQVKRTVYPLRLGYATTLHKIQGATLPHITVYMDQKWVKAAFYVALSRVRYDHQWRFMGTLTWQHCIPAD